MDKKDKLSLELKAIMIEETRDISLSQASIEKILGHRNKGFVEKIKDFLNKEVEIPLTPALIGFGVFIIISSIPKNIFKNQKVQVVNIGSSQVVIRESQVAKK